MGWQVGWVDADNNDLHDKFQLTLAIIIAIVVVVVWWCWHLQARPLLTGPDGLQEVLISRYWRPPDHKSNNPNGNGPNLHIVKLKDPMPREYSTTLSPFLHSTTRAGVVAQPQIGQAPWQLQQSGGAANNSWLD